GGPYNGKQWHYYRLTTNAPNQTEVVGDNERYLCYNNPYEATPYAVLLPGVQLDAEQLAFSEVSGGAVIACFTGADGKMVAGYGYHQTTLATAKRYTAALKMTTGDICGTGYAYTTPGRWITIEDSLGVNDWT